MSNGRIILLNGFPGVGKLAIARALPHLLEDTAIRTRLIDNHLLIDPVAAIVPTRGIAHNTLRKEVRAVAFNAIRRELASDPGLTIIMTGCLAHNASDIAVLQEHLDIAPAYGFVAFWLINLRCEEGEHKKRFGDAARYAEGKTKLRDESILDGLVEQHELLDPRKLEGKVEVGQGVAMGYNELDTTELSVGQSAECIARMVGLA
jgi:hypothetical protein